MKNFIRRLVAIILSHKGSIYTKCLSCGSWGINTPGEFDCGNCGSKHTIEYYPCGRPQHQKTNYEKIITKENGKTCEGSQEGKVEVVFEYSTGRWNIETKIKESDKICERDGCTLFAEYKDPIGDNLCSDCIQSNVESCEYTWDECEVLE